MNYILCLDIGGTKTVAGIVDPIEKSVIYKTSVPTIRGLSEFPIFLGKQINDLIAIASTKGYSIESTIGIAMPGNFKAGREIKLKKGSGRQLIRHDETYDNDNISTWLTSNIPDGFSMIAMNDALAQAMGGIATSWLNDYKNQTILYIGPGTGLGGAIIKAGDDYNQCKVISDGHIYDILVEHHGQKIQAEDILSGRAIQQRTGKDAKTLNESDDLWNQHLELIHDCGTCCVSLVNQLKNQSVEKARPDNQWSTDVQSEVANISVILLGGSIGTQGRIGQYLHDRLDTETDCYIVKLPNPESCALVGALLIIQNKLSL